MPDVHPGDRVEFQIDGPGRPANSTVAEHGPTMKRHASAAYQAKPHCRSPAGDATVRLLADGTLLTGDRGGLAVVGHWEQVLGLGLVHADCAAELFQTARRTAGVCSSRWHSWHDNAPVSWRPDSRLHAP